MEQKKLEQALPDEPEHICPECAHPELRTDWIDHTFPYGAGPDPAMIQARLPVRVCQKCAFEFFDWEAEDLKHEAVCRHRGVLTPNEIRNLREKLGMSRAEFAQLTKLGEATIARWERGELIQNAANDRYLRLLANSSENVHFLANFGAQSIRSTDASTEASSSQ